MGLGLTLLSKELGFGTIMYQYLRNKSLETKFFVTQLYHVKKVLVKTAVFIDFSDFVVQIAINLVLF